MMPVLDLRSTYPRSPNERLGGYVHLGRMIDKARAKVAGALGEYIYPCPLDQALLEFLGIDPEALLEAARTRSDAEMERWINGHASAHSPEQIREWNRAFLDRAPKDPESLRHFLEIRNRVAPERTDVTTWVDLLDLEEGRPV